MRDRIETNWYQLSRQQLAYWSAFEYVKRFWPALISVPISGILVMIFIPIPAVRAIAWMMIFWPISIPARSIIITSKAAKRALVKTKAVLEGDHLYFVTDPDEFCSRVKIDSIREIAVRIDYIAVELWRTRLIYIPTKAFKTKGDIQQLRVLTGVTQVER